MVSPTTNKILKCRTEGSRAEAQEVACRNETLAYERSTHTARHEEVNKTAAVNSRRAGRETSQAASHNNYGLLSAPQRGDAHHYGFSASDLTTLPKERSHKDLAKTWRKTARQLVLTESLFLIGAESQTNCGPSQAISLGQGSPPSLNIRTGEAVPVRCDCPSGLNLRFSLGLR